MPVQYLDSLFEYETAFLAKHQIEKSWRKVAEPYSIHPDTARLIADGYDPGNIVRTRLRLPLKESVEGCLRCGIVHTTKRCTSTNHNPRPPRIAIRLDNPESAVRSIRKHMEPEVIAELIEFLKDEQ